MHKAHLTPVTIQQKLPICASSFHAGVKWVPAQSPDYLSWNLLQEAGN